MSASFTGKTQKPGCRRTVASVLFAEGPLQVLLLYKEVQPMNEEEKDHEYESLSRPACECGAEQREQPSSNLRVSAVAVRTALYQLARFEA